MKFNFLAGITLLLMSSSIAGVVEAQITSHTKCSWVKTCAIALNQEETSKSVTPSDKAATVMSNMPLPEEKLATVAALTSQPHGNASTFGKSLNPISQILPPTDSNGNRIFRSTRSGPSYIGVGANFGISGGSDLGGTSFAVISKLGLTESLSVRPSVLVLRDFATILLPITYDFAPQQPFSNFQLSPYLGGGIAINTGANSSVGPMITAGVDIPLSSAFTINVAANLAFLNSTNLGILVGIGYNF
jgi:outer membrane protein W